MSYSISDLCTGCTACFKNCPVQAVSGAPKAQHAINPKRCVSCGVCGRVCPKGAVLDDAGAPCAALPRPRWPKPAIDASLCSACGMCVSVCRAGALRISPPAYRGDYHVFAELFEPKKCVACALCVAECPLNAIRMEEVETA
ncbi:MAG: 4Fe-4S binding protein [Clostridia bacterium]|nr:4Fe-4S binding protein [Clostridia bacterium]